MRTRRFGLLLLASFGASCGGPGGELPDAGPSSCKSTPSPTFELGTGVSAFEPIVDGQDLEYAPGSQGGCHFWLAVRTRGFPSRGTKLRYEVVFADTGTTTMSRSSFAIPLNATDDPEVCEHYGATAFLVRPWTYEDRRVRIETEVWYEPASGQKIAATASKEVVARWPGSDPRLCGPRN